MRIILLVLLLTFMPVSMGFTAITQDDFEVKGINLLTSTYDDVIAKLGKPSKQKVDEEGEKLTYLTYGGMHIWTAGDGKISYMRIDGNDYQTKRGVRVGGTAYKVVKEYGEPQKQIIRGHSYYIYKLDPLDKNRLIFDMSEGYVSQVIFTRMLDNP